MEHILVDFNTVMQDVEQGSRVTLGTDEDMATGTLPKLCPGDRVIAYDDEMEVEGVVEHQGTFWLAALDWNSLRRVIPAR